MGCIPVNRPHCPRCRTGLDLPSDGRYRCSQCRRTFEYFRSAYQAPALLTPESPDGSRCAEHGGNPATRLCERCGDFLCSLCITPIEGRVYCPKCFELLCARGAFRFSHTGFAAPRTALSLAGIAWMALFVPGLNLVIAGLAVVHGVTALKRLQERPDLPGRPQAIAALVLAGLNVLLFLAAAACVAWLLLKQF